MNYNHQSIILHQKLRGKIEVKAKKIIRNKKDLSLLYSPGVAEACKVISQKPEKINELTWRNNTILIVTDGTAILGLGDLGPAAALPVMEGKSVLFKQFGGLNCVPICLATKDVQEIVDTVVRIAPAYGGVNLEDISAPRCFEIEEKLKEKLNIPVFHDDQHGTAIVVVAGLINILKITAKKAQDLKVVINGIGAAGVAIAKLLFKFGVKAENTVLCDRSGILYAGRQENMNSFKSELALITNTNHKKGTLTEAVIGADLFIGVSAKGALTIEMAKSMAPDAAVFALANPDPEITPEDAQLAGIKYLATGRSDYANQVNNLLAFPGIFKGALASGTRRITDDHKLAAAQAIASLVKKPTAAKFIPDPFQKGVAEAVSKIF